MTTQLNTALTLAYERGRRDAYDAAQLTEPPDPPLTTLDILQWIETEHPDVDNHLPACPTLSGEWADSETPTTVVRAVRMESALTHKLADVDDNEICEAWERGVNDALYQACAAKLRQLESTS